MASFDLITDKGAFLADNPQPAVVIDVVQQPTIFTLYTQPSSGVECLADTQIVEQVGDGNKLFKLDIAPLLSVNQRLGQPKFNALYRRYALPRIAKT